MRALLAVAILAAASQAHATAKSVAVLGVSGVGGPRFAELLEQDLGDLYDLVPGEVYRRTAERLDKRGASPEEVRTVGVHLRLDALIAGAISGEGRARVLVIVIREGLTGRIVARARYDLSGRTLPLLRERVTSDLVRALERVRPVPRVGSPAANVEPPPASGTEEEPQPAEAGEPELAASVQRKGPPSEKATNGITAGVGVSLLARTLHFDVASAPAYSGGTVVGIRADGSVFPLGLSAELAEAHPVLASFGLVGSYEHVFSFNSNGPNLSSVGHASRWMVLFVGRIPLGHAARGGTLTIETGFQELSWGSHSPVDIGVPDVNYDLVDAGLGWERAIGTRYLVLSLRVAFLGLVGAGDIASPTQYGAMNGWGLEADGGLTAWPARWLWMRLGARYTPIVLSIATAGTRFARSAVDQWGSGFLEVGFAL